MLHYAISQAVSKHSRAKAVAVTDLDYIILHVKYSCANDLAVRYNHSAAAILVESIVTCGMQLVA